MKTNFPPDHLPYCPCGRGSFNHKAFGQVLIFYMRKRWHLLVNSNKILTTQVIGFTVTVKRPLFKSFDLHGFPTLNFER